MYLISTFRWFTANEYNKIESSTIISASTVSSFVHVEHEEIIFPILF